MESRNLKEREATAFKSGMCVCMYMYIICFKYYTVMTYSYMYNEAISFEAAAFVGFLQMHEWMNFFFSVQWVNNAILISHRYSELGSNFSLHQKKVLNVHAFIATYIGYKIV